MASQIRSSLRDILLALKAEILARVTYTNIDGDVASLSDAHVIITVKDAASVQHTLAPHDILLQPLEEHPYPGTDDNTGSSWIADHRVRSVKVTMRTRLSLDPTQEDLQRLTHESLGHIVFEDAVYDACYVFLAEDSDENVLQTGPAITKSMTAPKEDKDDDSWVSSSFTLDIPYSRDLDQVRPR